MTDKELLELAAKAAGIELKWMTQLGNGVKRDEDFISNWHPLTDDGDALRLAVKLDLEILFTYNTVRALPHTRGILHIENKSDDPYAATRQAIVRAAAEIGKTL
jgi:hypothetical protein